MDRCRLFAATDACVAPVLSLWEARDHPHNRARNAFVTSGALERPARAALFALPADACRHAGRSSLSGGDRAGTLRPFGKRN
ncbi:MAG: hypothetical protein EOQ86_23630 [Mesorhizobium sp.]|nr:MAG: hypothetical protein EOQ85_23870 [Mesorhizobium sp.]RWH79068.1 MAG: hypothetical protein EOQ86_23630 [Mesorhizobium sp.]RWH88255.1 MAG: hypothetical protein EOQ87_22965 [Mesorhizobium sp.]RWH94802.1 MAG: hypothetical protein EOQ88_25115 [Mesorhizobium sp.]RWH98725.1 MAG: hypothetical protein EOQ89_22915 [Mesorhizobium sp.]